MATFGDIVAYAFRADLYCPRCIVDVLGHDSPLVLENDPAEVSLSILATLRGIDREDERTFDSDRFPFPKVVLYDMIHDDSPTFCAQCGKRLNPKGGDSTSELRFNDRASWVAKLWEALDLMDWHGAKAEYPDDDNRYTEFENDVKTAMAWISEALGVESPTE